MEKIKGINPERIEWCSTRQGISSEQLAKDLQIAAATMEKVMAGKPALTIKQLGKIAAHFNRGILFFMEKSKPKAKKVFSAQYRTIANQKPDISHKLQAIVERMEGHRKIFIALREEVGAKPKPHFYPAKFNLAKQDIKKSAAKARQWLRLADENSLNDFRQALEAKHVMVFMLHGYKGKWEFAPDSAVRGLSLYFKSFPIIAIKKQGTDGHKAFTLIHELGHLLLHQESIIDEEGDFSCYTGKEAEANAFAGNFLVPDAFLEQIDMEAFPSDASGFDAHLKKQCKEWCVSSEVILRRLMDEDKLSSQAYGAYRAWKASLPVPVAKKGGSRKYRYREPLHLFGRSYVGTVLEALENQRITLAKASSYLDNLKIPDLHKLEDHVYI